MAAAYCYEGIPLRLLALFFDIQTCYLSVYEISMVDKVKPRVKANPALNNRSQVLYYRLVYVALTI